MVNEDRVRGTVGALARLVLNWTLLVLITMSAAISLETVSPPVHHLRWNDATTVDSLYHDLDLTRECIELTGNADCITPDLPREIPEG
jgi:hypothetical protein